jgi:hypothetical protein
MDLSAGQRDFHLAEFASLKADANAAVTSAAAHFRWAAAMSGLLLTWFWTQGQDFDVPTGLFFVPAAIALLLGGNAAALHLRVARIGRYLRALETALGNPALGWEEAFARRRRLLVAVHAGAWVVLLLGDVYGGLALQADLTADQQYETRETSTI